MVHIFLPRPPSARKEVHGDNCVWSRQGPSYSGVLCGGNQGGGRKCGLLLGGSPIWVVAVFWVGKCCCISKMFFYPRLNSCTVLLHFRIKSISVNKCHSAIVVWCLSSLSLPQASQCLVAMAETALHSNNSPLSTPPAILAWNTKASNRLVLSWCVCGCEPIEPKGPKGRARRLFRSKVDGFLPQPQHRQLVNGSATPRTSRSEAEPESGQELLENKDTRRS